MAVYPLHAAPERHRIDWRGRAKAVRSALRTVKAPQSVRNAMSMPLTNLGVASISAGVMLISLSAGLIVAGILMIGLEFIIADEK